MRNSFIYIIFVVFLASCAKQQYVITSIKGEYIPVKPTGRPDSKMASMVNDYKKQMDEKMGVVIGHSAQYMPYAKPESLLTNFTSDAIKQLDARYTDGRPVDLTLMNVNGHRAAIPQGDVTVGNLFSTYSFENELVVVRLKGTDLLELFDNYAAMGGAGISGNVKLVIKDKKIVSATVDGQPVDKNKIYTIVTLDYLAEGNDGMKALKKAESVTPTGLTLRDYMIEYVKNLTQQGKEITSRLDGRIVVE